MIAELHPASALIGGGLLLPFLPERARRWAFPIFALLGLPLVLNEEAATGTLHIMGLELEPVRNDRLGRLFGLLFHLAAFIGGIYSFHVRERGRQAMALLYAGSAVGAVYAGDFLSLFVFWELLAITSVVQVFTGGTPQSRGAGMRYLLLHVLSGVLLMIGAALHFHETGSLAVVGLGLDGPAGWLVLAAVGIKCAFPFVHTWLVDAYPVASPAGTVFLCCFTTKAAVCILARTFAGTELLITIGAVMAMFPIFYAVIENDLRRVLGYSMINQVGFMVVGIGLGAGMGLNGAVAHAFNDVFFKGLLFMTMGAVLYRTGRICGSDLGGLYKAMPWTCLFCMVGAASISAFPGCSGFVSKSMVIKAAADQGHLWVWLILLFAAAGVFHHAGIKIPFFAFFAHDSGLRPKEAPRSMLIAMALAATMCIGIGCKPELLYSLLPTEVDYEPYTPTHVLTQLQILFFSALAFVVLMLTKLYPPELPSTNLDADWSWRRGLPRLMRRSVVPAVQATTQGLATSGRVLQALAASLLRPPRSSTGETPATLSFVLGGMLAVYLAILLLG